jgi:hypothetical protein
MAAGIAYDAKAGYVVLFGGTGAFANLNDTWTFQNGIWTNQTSSVAPPVRFFPGMAYNARSGSVLLFGGCSFQLAGQTTCPGGALKDTWSFSGGVWTDISRKHSPSARYLSVMHYDPHVRAIILFGGENSSGYLNDTWALLGNRWSLLPTPVAPSPRVGEGFAYFPRTNELVLFGGATNNGFVGDLWTLAGSTWTKAALTGVAPSARDLPGAFAYDPQGSMLLAFGGYDGSYLIDTWSLT